MAWLMRCSLTRFLSHVDHVDKWKLMHRELPSSAIVKQQANEADAEMETWVNEKSNLVFIGDACHPMLPYLAQGANSSLEDGAVLGHLLGHMKNKSQLPEILRLYESLRKSRGEAIVRETFKQVRNEQPYELALCSANNNAATRLPYARRRRTKEAR